MGPCSATLPCSRTVTWSKLRIVSTRCAIAMTVVMGNSWRIVFCTTSWVFGSRAEVHSSSNNTGGWRMTMRAKLRSCRWPKLMFEPSLQTHASMLPGSVRTKLRSCMLLMASQILASGNSLKGSMLLRQEPSKMVGSWGTRPTRERRVLRPMPAASMPLKRMRPPRVSRTRSRQSIVVDLPQPVWPAMAIFMRGAMSMLMPWSTFFSLP
mmetsp:Transcript_103654/g.322316  ORF Transcript_103654/g.322316 Transcript_103654/m.322316 type:complete len:209 (+) Transcript_103654:208-834(+)